MQMEGHVVDLLPEKKKKWDVWKTAVSSRHWIWSKCPLNRFLFKMPGVNKPDSIEPNEWVVENYNLFLLEIVSLCSPTLALKSLQSLCWYQTSYPPASVSRENCNPIMSISVVVQRHSEDLHLPLLGQQTALATCFCLRLLLWCQLPLLSKTYVTSWLPRLTWVKPRRIYYNI